MRTDRVAVLGAGAWGTALATSFHRAGLDCVLWGRDAETVAAIVESRRNPRYLGDIALPEGMKATTDLDTALAGAGIVVLAVPAQTMRGFLSAIADRTPPDAVFVCVAKGIDRETGRTMSEIIDEIAGRDRSAVLSGPSFAADVASGLPTAVTVAAHDIEAAKALAAALSSRTLRCYASDDLAGVELGGALKNVLAIAAGIVHGRALGASALAALTARGFAELRRFASALGARPETLSGLSGLGDLILTCGSEKSRNFAYGAALARGDDLGGMKLAEGVHTASVAARMAREHGIDAPIVFAVDAILAGRISIDEAMSALMSRPLKTET
ncbi:NAD(P)H-dependent glycerol-3-phosphate dehydrogenase [Oricola thermophila]|uniref:Glycerol-3-phosphate dehydrogenase [NAD(P)+] n=1 Tax=Oricola thermophila TaxID=2742145 RepID=A0A6N1VJG2_9HYPH|nr:NAD(P)H-dependent glycerol-3-phosphate dehydrogenase [Oricola thermophila]QKV19885.1 NAD(P)-dependent glycerol-3-phosphate dehydrogenase [Oricola thermophila]